MAKTQNFDKFLEVLGKNFASKDIVYVGVNKENYNKKHEQEDMKFARTFTQAPVPFSALKNYIAQNCRQADVYICFNPVKGARKKANAGDSYIIAIDIDGVKVPDDELAPSYYWETSPDKYQGIWVVDNLLTPTEQEELARKLVLKYGFDSASADIVHFYRPPGTFNHKYKGDPIRVSNMYGEGTVFRKRDLMKALSKVSVTVSGDISSEAIKDIRYSLDDLQDKYDLLPLWNNRKILDRSTYAYNIEKRMIEKGANKSEIKFILLNLPREYQKFDISNVDAEVHRVFAKNEPLPPDPKEQVSMKRQPDIGGKKKIGKASVSYTKVADIKEIDLSDKWLIEDVWANNSAGVIIAPPKSFKSTLTTNLSVAVASGEPFDGKRVKQGGVFIVQAENDLGQERAKIEAIHGSVDLPIYYSDEHITLDRIIKLKQVIKDLDIKLLIIDPLYLLFGVGDINKHQDVTQRLENLTELKKQTGVSIMLVHHTRKLERGTRVSSSDAYGSAFIEGWYESMITLQRNENMTSSTMTTYFRNARSGDKYILAVDDDMKCRMIPLAEDDKVKVNKPRIKKEAVNEQSQRGD